MNIGIHSKGENIMKSRNKIVDGILNNICLDERIVDGTFDVTNNEHVDVMREFLVKRGIDENEVREFSNRVVEAGKHPDRQAYNTNGILVTFPTPQHKQNAIRRGTHFEKDPTKGNPNIFGPDPETGKPRRPVGRPKKSDAEKDDGEYTPPAEGGGQSITPTGDASSLPVSGGDTEQAPSTDDTATTTAAPNPDGESAPAEPAEQGPPDVLPAKPPEEKEQDRKAVRKMMARKSVSLGADTPNENFSPVEMAKLHIREALRVIENAENQ